MNPSTNIIVSGASRGIGLAISEQLQKLGYHVVGLARNHSQAASPSFTPYTVDLADLDQLPKHLSAIAKTHGPCRGLVCCAGKGQFGNLEEFSYPQIEALLALNFTSHAFMARALLPGLKRNGQGDIVFIGSEAALQGSRKGSIYCASKFALRGFAQALREECASSGVRVCIINPGMVKTDFFAQQSFRPGAHADNYITAQEVADAVALVINTRHSTVFDEINLSPLKKVIDFGSPSQT